MATLLAGCGYQLKGQFQFAEGLDPLAWQAAGDQEALYLVMRETFALYGLVLHTRPAETQLRVDSVSTDTVSLSEAEMLSLAVEWSLVNRHGRAVIDHRRTRAETRLGLSPEVDEEDARAERLDYLRGRIALRVLDQLEALPAEALDRQPEVVQP